jgi:DNA polymerase-3 subunit alpha
MIVILDKVLERNHRRQKVDPNQMCLFKPKPVRVEVPEVEEWPTDQILDFEKKLLGMYVTSHPMNKYENTLKKLKIKDIASLYEGPKRDKKVTAIGVVENVKLTTTRRKNERMAIIKIEDKSASVESFVFPRVYAKYLTYLVKGKIIAVTGRVQAKEQIPNIIAEEITPIEDIFSQVKELNIIVKKNSFKPKVLKDIFSKHQGGTPVYFILRKSRFRGVKIRTADNYHLALSESLLDNIGDIVGQDNIRIRL